MFFQVISLLGAALILAAYVGNQKRWTGPTHVTYNLANLIGSLLLLWVAMIDRRIGFMVLESAWALASIPPLLMRPTPDNTALDHSGEA